MLRQVPQLFKVQPRRIPRCFLLLPKDLLHLQLSRIPQFNHPFCQVGIQILWPTCIGTECLILIRMPLLDLMTNLGRHRQVLRLSLLREKENATGRGIEIGGQVMMTTIVIRGGSIIEGIVRDTAHDPTMIGMAGGMGRDEGEYIGGCIIGESGIGNAPVDLSRHVTHHFKLWM